jgi:hypothetical protein
MLTVELQLQKLAEQVVTGVSLPVRDLRNQEHVRARELGEHHGRVVAVKDRVAKIGREPGQHRRPQQKAPVSGASVVRTSSVR